MPSMGELTKSATFEERKESSMERHDLYNFESKINYKYSQERISRKKASYLLDTYFFIPRF